MWFYFDFLNQHPHFTIWLSSLWLLTNPLAWNWQTTFCFNQCSSYKKNIFSWLCSCSTFRQQSQCFYWSTESHEGLDIYILGRQPSIKRHLSPSDFMDIIIWLHFFVTAEIVLVIFVLVNIQFLCARAPLLSFVTMSTHTLIMTRSKKIFPPVWVNLAKNYSDQIFIFSIYPFPFSRVT